MSPFTSFLRKRHAEVVPLLKYPPSICVSAFHGSLSCSLFFCWHYGLIQSRGQCSWPLGRHTIYHSYTDPQSCTYYLARDYSVWTRCWTTSSDSTCSQRKLFPSPPFFLGAKRININVIMLTVNWHTWAKCSIKLPSSLHYSWWPFSLESQSSAVARLIADLSVHCSPQLVSLAAPSDNDLVLWAQECRLLVCWEGRNWWEM